MAIDTREKRQSIIGITHHTPSPTPNASKDQEWRQQAGYGYSGILVSAITGSVTLTAPTLNQTLAAPTINQTLEVDTQP